MFFIISKIAGFLTTPTHVAVGLVTLGALLLWTRWRRAARRIVTAGVIFLFALAFLPLSAILVAPLENRFPLPRGDIGAPTGIVVLGGSTDEHIEEARGQVTLTDAGERLTAGAALARRFPQGKLVFTGGSASFLGNNLTEANSARRFWTELGVPQDHAMYEDRSRNTYENAIFTRDLVQPKAGETWLLVTSAMHMPRSIGIFRKVGFQVIAYPTDYRTLGDARDFLPSLDASRAMRNLDTAVHEWIGLVGYRLTGKADALFAAP
ncbi:MAG: hypothetical protein QOF41_1044 [Methylobacteriaceae bacterium]|nr:hypothetical protein [Methylobacteriaceae bacterium]